MTKRCVICGKPVLKCGKFWVAVCKGRCARVRKSNLQREARVASVPHCNRKLLDVLGGIGVRAGSLEGRGGPVGGQEF